MFFKNLQLYRLPAPWAMSADALAAALAPHTFVPPSSNELLRQGWTAPRGAGLVHSVGGQYLLQLATEKKLLPAAVIRQAAQDRAAALEREQGFAPGKKAMQELRERVADELLPRAFPVKSALHVWIDPANGWLAIDTANAASADGVVKLLLKAVDRMPLASLRVAHAPVAVMTGWLDADEAPAGFSIDQDAQLRAAGESRAEVGYRRHTLEPDDMRRHIAAGKQCTRLALTWNSRISFVLTETLALRAIRPLDVLKEGAAAAYNDDERFDSDFALMAGEYAQLLADLAAALGGEAAT
jgi:recombination associated protein RdgC